MDTALKTRMSPSLALLTIANMLRQHEIRIVNENIEDIDYNGAPDIAGITVTVDVMPRAAEISRRFREKGVFTVAGGIHITANPQSAEEYFDAICVGAAEATWPGLIEDVMNGRPKKKYVCPTDFTGREIVSPAYDLLDRSRYLYTNVVSTSRGCPYRCGFCYNSAGGGKASYLNRPIADVINDIIATGSRHVMFVDDNFIGNPEWTRSLLKAITPMNLKWNAAVSSNIVYMPELLDQMKRSGCQSLFIGFESLNAQSLKDAGKGQNHVEKYEALTAMIHRRGIMINASFVFGLDGDDASTFRATLDWLVRNRIETVTSHILTPYPGTKLHSELLLQNRITDFNLENYNTAHVMYKPKNMTAQELYDGYLRIYEELYSFKNIMKRLPEHKNQWIPYLAFNFLYRKFGRFTEKLCRFLTFNYIGRLARYISYKV